MRSHMSSSLHFSIAPGPEDLQRHRVIRKSDALRPSPQVEIVPPEGDGTPPIGPTECLVNCRQKRSSRSSERPYFGCRSSQMLIEWSAATETWNCELVVSTRPEN